MGGQHEPQNAHRTSWPHAPRRGKPLQPGLGRNRRHRRGGRLDRRRCLSLLLPPAQHGRDAQAVHQHRARQGLRQRAYEHVHQHPRISAGNFQGRGAAQLRHALLIRLARHDEGTGGDLRARHRRPLLPAAHARHVDRRLRLARLAHHRHHGGGLPRHPARLVRQGAGWRDPDPRPHALCLDHRSHQDRRPCRL